jgi:hypothetical protein
MMQLGHIESPANVGARNGTPDERVWGRNRNPELDLQAALSHHTFLALGCYRQDESHCHRFLSRELLMEPGSDVV